MNNTLPDDIEQLKALLIAQQAAIVRLSGEITGYAREIGSLRALVAKLQRMLFGRSSEKNREKIEKKIARAETRITELQNRLGEAQSQLTSMAGDTAPKASDSPVRKALPATLPRDRQVISPAETECPVCSGKLKPLGESISEQLDIINTAFRVIKLEGLDDYHRRDFQVKKLMRGHKHDLLKSVAKHGAEVMNNNNQFDEICVRREDTEGKLNIEFPVMAEFLPPVLTVNDCTYQGFRAHLPQKSQIRYLSN